MLFMAAPSWHWQLATAAAAAASGAYPGHKVDELAVVSLQTARKYS